jgi:hypothetical protein
MFFLVALSHELFLLLPLVKDDAGLHTSGSTPLFANAILAAPLKVLLVLDDFPADSRHRSRAWILVDEDKKSRYPNQSNHPVGVQVIRLAYYLDTVQKSYCTLYSLPLNSH